MIAKIEPSEEHRLEAARWLGLGLAAALVGYVLWLGPVVQTRQGHDSILFLMAGWRVALGQHPNADFHTALGPVTLELAGLAVRLAHRTAWALPLGLAIFAAMAVLASMAIGWRRLSPPLHALWLILVALIVLGPRMMGAGYTDLSYLGLYNRLGFALTSVLLVACWVPHGSPAPERSFRAFDAGLVGFTAVTLCFIKPNFAVASVLFTGVGVLCVDRTRLRILGLLTGATLGVVAWGACIDFDFVSLFSDVASAMRVKLQVAETALPGLSEGRVSHDVLQFGPGKMLAYLRAESMTVLVLAALAVFRPRSFGWGPLGRRGVVLGVVLSALVVTTDTVMAYGNFQFAGMPSAAAMGLVLVEQCTRRSPAAAVSPIWRRALLSAAAGLVALAVGGDALALGYAASVRTTDPPTAFTSPALRDLKILNASSWCRPREYPARINEGLQALQSMSPSPATRILVADSFDPFNFALGTTPPRDTLLWWQYGVSFLDRSAAPDGLSDANVLMIPRCAEDTRTAAKIQETYAQEIQEDFVVAAETESWVILRRHR